MALKKIKGSSFTESRSFKDLSVGFTRNANTKDVAIVKNDNAIKQAVKNLILTVPCETPFQPEIGSRISELLFEPLDPFTSDSIKQEVINTISQYEPRVRIVNVFVKANFDKNSFDVELRYQIVGLPPVESIEFVLQRPE